VLRLTTKLEQVENPQVAVVVSDLQVKESKLLSDSTKLGIIGQVEKLLSIASNNNQLIQEPYNTVEQSLEQVIAELSKLHNLGEAHTFSITKVADSSGTIKLLVEIRPTIPL
jgi:hypothetical protein